jgi:hypothetical protein
VRGKPPYAQVGVPVPFGVTRVELLGVGQVTEARGWQTTRVGWPEGAGQLAPYVLEEGIPQHSTPWHRSSSPMLIAG